MWCAVVTITITIVNCQYRQFIGWYHRLALLDWLGDSATRIVDGDYNVVLLDHILHVCFVTSRSTRFLMRMVLILWCACQLLQYPDLWSLSITTQQLDVICYSLKFEKIGRKDSSYWILWYCKINDVWHTLHTPDNCFSRQKLCE